MATAIWTSAPLSASRDARPARGAAQGVRGTGRGRGALLVAAVAYGALSSTAGGFIAAGLLALAGQPAPQVGLIAPTGSWALPRTRGET